MKAKDYKDKSSPEKIDWAWEIINKIFEEFNKEQREIEEEIENEVFSISEYWGND